MGFGVYVGVEVKVVVAVCVAVDVDVDVLVGVDVGEGAGLNVGTFACCVVVDVHAKRKTQIMAAIGLRFFIGPSYLGTQ